MTKTLDELEFGCWEASQPLRFGLVEGRPVRLHEENQRPFRIARLEHIARQVLADEPSVRNWLTTPQVALGGFEPGAVAAGSENGSQLVLRSLIKLRRPSEAGHG